MFEDF